MLIILLSLPAGHFLLSRAGAGAGTAAFWAPTATAVIAMVLLWRTARASTPPQPEPVRRARLA